MASLINQLLISYIVTGLVAMATNVESLYAAVKCLVYVVKCNSDMHHEMERLHGYQTLAYLLKRHRLLVNNHVLHLIMLLAGTSDSDRDHLTTPNNSLAFRDLLADLDVNHSSIPSPFFSFTQPLE